MADQITDIELCDRAWMALKNQLGMAHAMRFMSLIRNPKRDYLAWRDERFKDLTPNELIDQLRAMPKSR